MLSSPPQPSVLPVDAVRSAPSDLPRRLKLLALLTFVLILAFSRFLYDLTRFAIHSQLYSYILLIPFISAYLVWLNAKRTVRTRSTASPYHRKRSHETLISAFFFLLGLISFAVYWWTRHSGALQAQDHLALVTFSFLSFFIGISVAILPIATLRPLVFPLAFLIFMVPFPSFLEHAVAYALQHGSADSAYALFKVSGMPVFKEGMSFQLPGFSLQVAPECSGIHSTLVLFITSFLAGHLLLSNVWHKAFLVLVIFPLALLRNGFRIFTLGQLCVRVSPDWINSDLHHHGGPIFFALSLVPFFALILWFRKQEVKKLKSLTVG